MKIAKRTSLALIIMLLVFSTQSFSSAKNPRESVLPNPVLYFLGPELYETGGKQFIRYTYDVANKDLYPDDLFAASPDLPPCGQNTKAARTWVDIYDQSGKRLQGFCALGKSSDLGKIWFGLEIDQVPPSYVYIEMNDRKTPVKYKSNLADTTL
jgi:hypothetical protein